MLRAVDPSRFEAVTIRVRLDDYACRPQINSRGTREPAACHARLDAVGKRSASDTRPEAPAALRFPRLAINSRDVSAGSASPGDIAVRAARHDGCCGS